MRRRLATLGIALACACGTLQGSSDGVPTTSSDGGGGAVDATARDAAGADVARGDAGAPSLQHCDGAIYCEDFTNRGTADDLAGTLAVASGGALDLVGTLGMPDRALRASGATTPGMRAMAYFDLGTPARKLSLAYSIKVTGSGNVNGPGLIFPQTPAPDWVVYHYFDNGQLHLAKYQTDPTFKSSLVGTLSTGSVHRIVLRVDLDQQKASTSLDGATPVELDLDVPAVLPAFRLEYGVLSDWTDSFADVTFDDVLVASP